jgi:predicted nuclease of predicted toxin-antitoxin system
MRILLDNCVNHRLSKVLPEFEAAHARQFGWEELSNGVLLTAAEEAGFRVIITVDKNFSYQQNLIGRKVNLVTIDARSITFVGLETLLVPLKQTLQRIDEENIQGRYFTVGESTLDP